MQTPVGTSALPRMRDGEFISLFFAILPTGFFMSGIQILFYASPREGVNRSGRDYNWDQGLSGKPGARNMVSFYGKGKKREILGQGKARTFH